ncbi:MAG TPA: hypothetical protein VNF47_12045 [Streptosporangiaceae bacterium]|nr:hypothetical protein [Streptosporangiaceae bacterium]
MSEPDAVPLPRGGEVFFDVRGDARSMRLSWYADSSVAVFSIWQGPRCTGTFRLPFKDLARMVAVLQSGPRPDQASTGSADHGYPEHGYQEHGYQEQGYPATSYLPGYDDGPARQEVPPYGTPGYGDHGYSDQPYGDQPYGDHGFGDPNYSGQGYSFPDYDPPPYGDVSRHEDTGRLADPGYPGRPYVTPHTNTAGDRYDEGPPFGAAQAAQPVAAARHGDWMAVPVPAPQHDGREESGDEGMLSFPSVPAGNGPYR